MYTFYTPLQTITDRVKLFVDNSLLISEWTGLSSLTPSGTLAIATALSYYDLTLEYKSPLGKPQTHNPKPETLNPKPYTP